MYVWDAIIATLCVLGLYCAIFMYLKARRASAGKLTEPSVVQSPVARMLGGVPNAVWGIAYYAALLAALPLLERPEVHAAADVAAAAAALFSLFLAYSLLFRTRQACVYCWTGHIVNWSLLLLLVVGHR